MGQEKLKEYISSKAEADPDLPDQSDTPRLSLVHPEQIDLEAALEKLADIIESEGGVLTP
jgi:hypothetical protein